MLAEKRGDPVLRVHTKAAVVDRRLVFIGSMNLDPRSAILNTEIGVVIDSEAFARDVLHVVELVMERGAWRVRLDPDGKLVWSNSDQPPTVLHQEPRTTAAQRWWLELLSVLVPESVL
jgi:putative cardiolipin synthase